jgi:hypothetical protein
VATEDLEALGRQLQSAEDLLRAGRYNAAFDAYEELLRKRLALGASAADSLASAAELVVVERLAQLSLLLGCGAAADPLLDAAAAACLTAGNHYASAYYTLQRALLALASGQLRAAKARLRDLASYIGDVETIDIGPAGLIRWEAGCRWPAADAAGQAVLLVRLYLAMGSLLSSLGQYAQAGHCLRRGLEHAGPQAPELARRARPHLLCALASARLEQGQVKEAAAELAAAGLRGAQQREPEIGALVLQFECKVALLRGEWGAALELLERFILLARAARLERAHAIAMLNAAQLRILLNQTTAAGALVEEAAAVAARIRDTGLERRVQLLRRLLRLRGRSLADAAAIAPAAWQLWHPDDAPEQTLAESALRETSASIDVPELTPACSFLEFFEDHALRLQWHLGEGDLVRASAALEAMGQIFADSDSHLIRLRLAVLRAMLDYYRASTGAECAGIASRLGQAIEELRARELRPELWQALRFRVWLGRRAGLPEARLRPWIEESDQLLSRMSQSLAEIERAVYLLNKWTADEEALAGEVEAVQRLRARLRAAPWWRRPALGRSMRVALDRLRWRIDRHKAAAGRMASDAPAGEVAPRAPSPFGWLRPWPWREANVATLVLPDRTLVLANCGWRIWFGVSPVTRVQWHEAVRAWHKPLRDALVGSVTEGAAARLTTAGDALARMLQLPSLTAQLPRRVRCLRIVPDDALHAVPFAALAVGPQPLVATHAVVLDAESARRRPAGSRRARHRDALLVGVAQACGSLPALPGAAAEIHGIEPILERLGWKPAALLDSEATKAAALAALSHAGVLHVASHGAFDPNQPGASGFVLPAPGGGAQPLTLRDLAGVDLSALQLAALSACWTANHVVLPGRWSIGLPEALRRAGAQSVLAWLWPAPDRYAAEMTWRFYELLATCRRDDALRRVYLEASTGRFDEALPPPLRGLPLWAGLQLYGASERLRP